jgi:DNA-3-methyladenine glycosylase
MGEEESHFSNGRIMETGQLTPKILSSSEFTLPQEFYDDNDTLSITQRLLGKYLIRQQGKRKWIGRIVETEAYIGETDPACHAFRGLTPRTKVMYGPPGHAYVYFTYGMHFMLNVVTETEGFPAAVLIRAVEPVSGFPSNDPRSGSGPGKLCKNMQIDKTLNGLPLFSKPLWIAGEPGCDQADLDIRWSPRVGVTGGAEKLWRAYIYGNPSVSRKSNRDDPKSPGPYLDPGGHGDTETRS